MKNQLNKNFIRWYRKSAKFDLTLSKAEFETIIGLMLGDLFAEKKILILIQDYNLNNLLKIKYILPIYMKYLKNFVVQNLK